MEMREINKDLKQHFKKLEDKFNSLVLQLNSNSSYPLTQTFDKLNNKETKENRHNDLLT